MWLRFVAPVRPYQKQLCHSEKIFRLTCVKVINHKQAGMGRAALEGYFQPVIYPISFEPLAESARVRARSRPEGGRYSRGSRLWKITYVVLMHRANAATVAGT